MPTHRALRFYPKARVVDAAQRKTVGKKIALGKKLNQYESFAAKKV
jgi:hypothetical protein